MIFLTVGTTSFQFDRLFSIVDEIIRKYKNDSYLIIQTGGSDYEWIYKQCKQYRYINYDTMLTYIKQSDKIITHAGFGTIFQIAHYAHVLPLIIPRMKIFNEHVDDHQVYFAKYLQNQIPNKYRNCICIDKTINQSVKKYILDKTKPNILKQYIFSSKEKKKIMRNMEKYINDLI